VLQVGCAACTPLCVCAASSSIRDLCVCEREECVSWVRAQPCLRPDPQAGRAQLHSWDWDREITWDRSQAGILGLLCLLSPLALLKRRVTIQWDLENRVGMEIGDGPEEAQDTPQRKMAVAVGTDHHVCSVLEGGCKSQECQ